MRHTTTTNQLLDQPSAQRVGNRSRALVCLLAILVLGLTLALTGRAGWTSAPAYASSITGGGSSGSGTDRLPDPGPGVIPTLTEETEGEGGKPKSPTPTAPVNMTPVAEARLVGWERETLRDLADVLNWPNTVTYDSSGRLKVQAVNSSTDWAVAHIRAFDYNAGAQAAFAAEQQDSRLSGLRLHSEVFYNYRAYSATLNDRSGAVVERRYRWLASTWILGVDIHRGGTNPQVPDPGVIATNFLTLAVRRGLPPPPDGGEVPTPNPTWGLPPLVTPTAPACDVAFSDVTGEYWAFPYIKQLACEGVISGYDDGTFRPERSTTRAQLVKMLVLSQRWGLATPGHPTFNDVGQQHPFFHYIETAVAHRLISGYGDGTFRPNAYVTRAQVAKMLVLTRGWDTSAAGSITPCDVERDHWAWSYIYTAVQHNLFTGYGDNCFRPDLPATRAQLSKVLALVQR
ncbi:MAG: S-layer homology domain-containing protein [Chloroflexia bacterium]